MEIEIQNTCNITCSLKKKEKHHLGLSPISLECPTTCNYLRNWICCQNYPKSNSTIWIFHNNSMEIYQSFPTQSVNAGEWSRVTIPNLPHAQFSAW